MQEVVLNVGFWDVFWPVFAALAASAVVFEGFYFLVSLWRARRQLDQLQARAEELKAQGLFPSNMMGQNGQQPMVFFDLPADPSQGGYPTTPSSGTNGPGDNTGQYI